MAKQILSPSLLRELFEYNPETGDLKWKVAVSSSANIGEKAGYINGDGYVVISLFLSRYRAHRLIWAISYGHHAEHEIDHINGDRQDNRLCNLRDVPRQANSENRRSANKDKASCRLLGVSYDRDSRAWKAQISFSGKNIHIGRFDTAEEAHHAYLIEKRRLHASCTI